MSRIVHFDIPSQDTGRAREFWGGLFGYQFQSMDGPVEYHMFQTGENEGGAVMQSEGQTGPHHLLRRR
jgi:predicted enzyme related to lactoylglutathione lyase